MQKYKYVRKPAKECVYLYDFQKTETERENLLEGLSSPF